MIKVELLNSDPALTQLVISDASRVLVLHLNKKAYDVFNYADYLYSDCDCFPYDFERIKEVIKEINANEDNFLFTVFDINEGIDDEPSFWEISILRGNKELILELTEPNYIYYRNIDTDTEVHCEYNFELIQNSLKEIQS